MQKLKDILREILIFLHLDVTKNLKYDRLTRIILKKNLKADYSCVDVGCHKGEILDMMLKFAPKGKHIGFEPIPYLYKDLVKNYSSKATIYPYALSDHEGNTTFNFVKNAPAYSGLKQREYKVENPDIEVIDVEIKTLDGLVGDQQSIEFIKIDVEGAELGVLKGAKNLLQQNKPTILFECGKGASEFYGTTPEDVYTYLNDTVDIPIFTLSAFIDGEKALSLEEFKHCFNTGEEYYFVASTRIL